MEKEKISFLNELKKTLFIFSKQQNKQLQRLNVKKGILNGLKYITYYFFTLPLFVFNVVIRVDDRLVNFLRHLSFFALTVFYDTKGEEKLNSVINNIVNALKLNTLNQFRVDYDALDSVVKYYRIYRILNAVVFFVFFSVVTLFGVEILSEIVSLVLGFFGISGGVAALDTTSDIFNPANFLGGSVLVLFLAIVLNVVIVLAIFSATIYVFVAAFKLSVREALAAIYVNKKEFEEFIIMRGDVVFAKISEEFGDEFMLKVIEYVTQVFALDENDLIYLKKIKIKLLEEVKNENNGVK